MDVFEAASTNVAVRDYQPRFISDAELRTILEAARLTQSAKNLQPWFFVVIKDRKTLDNLADLMKGDIDEVLLKKSPMAVAIVGDTSSEFWLFDLGRVAQTMTLVAWELGVASCIISGPEPPDRENYRTAAGKILGVGEGQRLQELIVFGYPKTNVKVRRKNRKKFEEIVFAEKLGRPIERVM
jgi:nitroreductase